MNKNHKYKVHIFHAIFIVILIVFQAIIYFEYIKITNKQKKYVVTSIIGDNDLGINVKTYSYKVRQVYDTTIMTDINSSTQLQIGSRVNLFEKENKKFELVSDLLKNLKFAAFLLLLGQFYLLFSAWVALKHPKYFKWGRY